MKNHSETKGISFFVFANKKEGEKVCFRVLSNCPFQESDRGSCFSLLLEKKIIDGLYWNEKRWANGIYHSLAEVSQEIMRGGKEYGFNHFSLVPLNLKIHAFMGQDKKYGYLRPLNWRERFVFKKEMKKCLKLFF